jgi:hypothetical protein
MLRFQKLMKNLFLTYVDSFVTVYILMQKSKIGF